MHVVTIVLCRGVHTQLDATRQRYEMRSNRVTRMVSNGSQSCPGLRAVLLLLASHMTLRVAPGPPLEQLVGAEVVAASSIVSCDGTAGENTSSAASVVVGGCGSGSYGDAGRASKGCPLLCNLSMRLC